MQLLQLSSEAEYALRRWYLVVQGIGRVTYDASVTVVDATGSEASRWRGSTHLIVLMGFRYIYTIPTHSPLLIIYMSAHWLPYTYWIIHIDASQRYMSVCVRASVFLFEPALP